MNIQSEYRLIHPKRVFLQVKGVFEEFFCTDMKINKSSGENSFRATLSLQNVGEEEEEGVDVKVEFIGKRKVWEMFEPFGEVWRTEVVVEIPEEAAMLAEKIKSALFKKTLRAGG